MNDWDAFNLLGFGLIVGWLVGLITAGAVMKKKRFAVPAAGGNSQVLAAINSLETTIMAKEDELLARVTALTDVATAIAAGVDVLNAEHVSIEEHIADLKAQIAAGTPPDFGPLDEKVTELEGVINSLKPAILKGTPAEPPVE